MRPVFCGLPLVAMSAPVAHGADWFPYPVEVWDPPFDMASPRTTVDYAPLSKAAKSLMSAFPSRT